MIEFDVSIPAPRMFVWECLTDGKHIQHWWGEGVTLNAEAKGEFFEPWTDKHGQKHTTRGNVTAIDPGERLQFDWKDEDWPQPTRVEFLLKENDGGTQLYLSHSGWDIFSDDQRSIKVDEHRKGWRELISNFRNYCIQEYQK